MANGNGNGFKVAFWVMATIALFGIGSLSGYVVANDRIRASEDQRVEEKLTENLKFVEVKVDKNKEYFYEIKAQLARIEEKLGIE